MKFINLILTSLSSVMLFACNNDPSSGVDPGSHSLQDGKNAYFSMDHSVAYSVFTNVWQDTVQTLEDRTAAARYLAKMDWLFYRKNEKAHALLDTLEQLDHALSWTYLLRTRLLAKELKWDEAIAASSLALENSISETEKYHAQLFYVQALFEKQKALALAGEDVSAYTNPKSQQAYDLLQNLARDKPGDVDIAKRYLGYSLLLGRGEESFTAWMSYYRLTDIDQVHPSLLKAPHAFRDALFRYTPNNKTKSDLVVIIKGLAESGFYEFSQMVKKVHFGDGLHTDPTINNIGSYVHFLRGIDSVTHAFYIKTINGDENKKHYMQAMFVKGKKLWDALSWQGDKPPLSEENLVKELRKRFKAVVKFMSANGYYGLHMGHVMLDDKRTIEQYREKAEFRYVAIDHMISNGYSGWFWDGEAETGGWANDDGSFLQVRSAYTGGPILSWLTVTDSVEIQKTQKKIRKLRALDDSLALEDKHAYLPGLNEWINYNEKKEILDSLKNTGLSGSALRLKFINALERIVLESSIYAHEGRHAIDKKNNYSYSSEELEYTAKLSEIYFSRKPLLSFNAVLSRNIGDGTSHGNANLRVIKKLVQWIENHAHIIAAYDTDQAALVQIYKLTDAQLRSAIRAIDPMAKQ